MRGIFLASLLLVLTWAESGSAQALRVRTVASNFNGSGGVVVLPGGDILVADFGSGLPDGRGVLRITTEGAQTPYAVGLSGASGNAVHPDGRLIQSNIGLSAVVAIDPDGRLTTLSTGISTPIGVAIRSDGSIYVAACGSNQIMRAVPGAAAAVYVSSPLLSCPNGLTVDDQDNLYAVNFSDSRMVRIDTSGRASLFAEIPGNGNGHVIFGNDHFYVTANRANQIYQVDRQGQVSLLAGDGNFDYDDGAPEEASFNRPNGIGISPDGRTLYVSQRRSRFTGGGLHPNVLRAIDLDLGQPPLPINVGLRGSWYSPLTPGQGILIDLVDGQSTMFAAWYSFIAANDQADPSGNDQRWYSLQGEYSANRAVLTIYDNSGGRFDAADPVTTTAIGQFELDFADCTHALAHYRFTDPERSGAISMVRLSPDVLCSSLAEIGRE